MSYIESIGHTYSVQGAEAPLPKPGSASKKVKTLVEDIAKLTLLEVAELNELLKVIVRYNPTDQPRPS